MFKYKKGKTDMYYIMKILIIVVAQIFITMSLSAHKLTQNQICWNIEPNKPLARAITIHLWSHIDHYEARQFLEDYSEFQPTQMWHCPCEPIGEPKSSYSCNSGSFAINTEIISEEDFMDLLRCDPRVARAVFSLSRNQLRVVMLKLYFNVCENEITESYKKFGHIGRKPNNKSELFFTFDNTTLQSVNISSAFAKDDRVQKSTFYTGWYPGVLITVEDVRDWWFLERFQEIVDYKGIEELKDFEFIDSFQSLHPILGNIRINVFDHLKYNEFLLAEVINMFSGASFLPLCFMLNMCYDPIHSEFEKEISVKHSYLLANFPNPFNPNTTINFTVGAGLASTRVTLEIFNIRGQRVRTLISGMKEPGHHSIVWDSTDGRGQSVSSGIYFYRLTAGDFVETRRMLLLK
jgi:hypothetical protein